jgi:uncharacterized protein YutE (UPF0331/DUF86 family)/predicted nucleotidyltransferase
MEEKITKLKEYFATKPEIEMAFIFGSHAKGNYISESDIDIAVYFKSSAREIEWEEKRNYNESDIWLEAEKILKQDTDFVVLNRAPAHLSFEILRTGIPIIIKNKNLYWKFFLLISQAAEDYREAIKDWWLIKERSQSISEEDKIRLIQTVDFIERELNEISKFQAITFQEYEEDKDKQRNIERWVERIVNASIDIAKIILASEKSPMPETYSDILGDFGEFIKLGEENIKQLKEFAKIRNILAHEYLDFRFERINKFIKNAKVIYDVIIKFAKQVIDN